MNKKSIVRGLLLMVFGLALVLWPQEVNTLLVKFIGCALLASALVVIIHGLSGDMFSNLQGMNLLSLAGAVLFIIFGLVLLIKTAFFLDFLNFLFGLILLLYGISQIVNVAKFKKAFGCSAKVFILPVVVTVIGILFFFGILGAPKILTMAFGICIIALGFSELLVLSRLKNQ